MNNKEVSEKREQNWEQVQVKAFKAWLNSYLSSRGSEVKDLFTDLQDGVMLLHFLECVQDKKLPNRWDPSPQRKVQKIENLSIALNYITTVMNVKLVGIGAEDIFEGHKKLILGLIWSLFRALRMTKLTAGVGSSSKKAIEEGLLRWVREQTTGYEGVNVSDFRYGFQDGLALAALINKFDPSLLDYSAAKKDGSVEAKKANLELAFSVAEKHMNIPKLLDASDLLEGDPDERSVQLYVSMFFHAFTSKEEKERIEREKGKLSAEMDSIASSLAREEEARKKLMHEKEELQKEQASMANDLAEKEKRAAELEKIKNELEEEVAELKRRLEEFEELQRREKEMQEKLEALEELAERETEAKEENLELAASLQEEVDKKRKEVEDLRAKVDASEDAKSNATKELASARETLQSDLEKLKKSLKREEAARIAREKLNAKLKAENEELRRKAEGLGEQKLAWDLLQKNLEEHLEDLYCWREVQNDGDVDPKKRIDVTSQIKPSTTSKNFAEQFALLNERLEEENRTLLKVLNVKDALLLKKDVADKQGYLVKKGQRNPNWKKRWVVLKGNELSYYISEQTLSDIKGSIALSSSVVTVEPAEDKERQWLLGISIEGGKLILQAESQKERDKWLAALNGSIAYQAYKEEAEKNSTRPDLRLLNFFTADATPSLHLDDRAISLESVTALARVLAFHDELRVLSIENADLRDAEASLLAEVIPKLGSLQVVKLGRNKLTSAAAVAITHALQNIKPLKEVYLNDNEIGDESLTELAKHLKELKQVSVFDLSGNKLGDKGAASVVDAITPDHNLESLLLSKNSIGDDGAIAVAGLLERNHTLATVQLHSNNIGDKGVVALARALQKNTSVSLLDISANDFGNEGALAIRKLLDKNMVLEGVNLSQNKIHGGPDLATFLETDAFFFPSLSFSRRIKIK